uniref:Aryl-alcohol n=1 Tax=Colletotrichum fructicola (strain Nara gc5) TaxID=1213859 RepID=L2FBI9_COLFN
MSDLNVLAPGLFPAMYGNPEYDWDHKTAPQPAANSKVVAHVRGKQLGGSSAMNLMFWTHPSRQDIDGWGELSNAGWSWDELAPCLRNSEALVAPPIANEFPQLQSPLLRTWPRTLENLGLAVRSDPQDVKALGGYVNLLNIDGATRSYAANAYLGAARCPNT